MKEGWTYKILLDCIYNIPKQKQVKSKDYKTKGLYPIVSQEKDLISGYWDDETYLYRHDKPIIIFGDHTKEIKFIDFDFVVGADGTKILYPKDNLDSKFFYYALIATPLRELGYARHFRLLKEKSFPIPPLSEQQRIVAQLDEAFAEIDTIKAAAEKQLSEAKALFQKALSKAMTPKEGWEKKKLGEVCDKITDGSHNPPKGIARSEYMMLSSQNIQNGFIDFSKVRYLNKQDFDNENKRTNAQKGDVLITIVGTIGRVCVLSGNEGNITFQRSVALLKPRNIIDSFFLMYYLMSRNTSLNDKAQGAAQKGIYLNQLSTIDIPNPPLSEQQRIVEELDELAENVKEIEALNNKLTAECDAMKQALLRQVFE